MYNIFQKFFIILFSQVEMVIAKKKCEELSVKYAKIKKSRYKCYLI